MGRKVYIVRLAQFAPVSFSCRHAMLEPATASLSRRLRNAPSMQIPAPSHTMCHSFASLIRRLRNARSMQMPVPAQAKLKRKNIEYVYSAQSTANFWLKFSPPLMAMYRSESFHISADGPSASGIGILTDCSTGDRTFKRACTLGRTSSG